MYYTPAVLVMLVQSIAVLGAPAGTSSASATVASTTAAPTVVTELSLTQRLFLADSAADRFPLLPDNKQFVFDFNQPQKNPGKGGELIAANRKTFPALVGTGASMAVGRVKPCGMNTLHVHPRGAELQLVVQGRLVTEMVPENGVLDANGKRRVISNTIEKFQMTPFYQGSVHTQFNPDCTDTVFIAAFPSEDFGTGQIADETFAFSNDILAATFGQSIDGAEIDRIRAAIPASIALGVEECLKRCGIPKRSN